MPGEMMIKFALVILFFLWLFWLQPLPQGDGLVALKMLPFTQTLRFGLDTMLFCVATVGLLFASLIAMVDQLALKRKNKLLTREAKVLREEVASLRNILTGEQESE